MQIEGQEVIAEELPLEGSLEEAARQAFTEVTADEPEPVDEPAESASTHGGEAGDEGGDGREGVPSPPSTPDLIELSDGVQVSREELIQWHEFGNFLRANPEYAEAVAGVLDPDKSARPGAPEPAVVDPAPAAAGSPLTPPAELDLDDPTVSALWSQHVATLETIARLEAVVQQHDRYVTSSQQETTDSLLATARAGYQKDHNLSDAEMQTVYDVAGRLAVLPSLLSPIDPITGAPRQVDAITAMQEAFEMARWNIPDLRERELQLKTDESKAVNKRKAKLSSLGGSSGSVPKTVPVPKTQQERRAAMVAEVAAMINGEGASE